MPEKWNNPAGRNLRSVWTIPTQQFPEAHFAVYPEALVEPCIKAGTSEKGCCSKCGAPWVRMVERTEEPDESGKGSFFDRGKTGARDGGDRTQPGPRFKSVFTGWSPSCDCGAEPIPCTVLDPFGGAGTTGVVALKLARNAILIDLSPEYCEMAERRIRDDAPLLNKEVVCKS